MVKFEEVVHDGELCLHIYDNDDKILVQILRPLTGKYADPLPDLKGVPTISKCTHFSRDVNDRVFLQSPWHTVEPSDHDVFPSLGRQIIAGETYWNFMLKNSGEFGYIPLYWEWCEDVLGRSHKLLYAAGLYQAVFASLFTYDRKPDIFRAFCEAWSPKTNSLLTSTGELSITLWDLYIIGGLPIIGGIYDEVNPRVDELLGTSSNVPVSCQYLFIAYHHILMEDTHTGFVKFEDWTSFWFGGKAKYKKITRPKAPNKTRRPTSTANPSGEVPPPIDWSIEMPVVFANLGVPDHLKEEVYLAAFISCWLCAFALPGKNGNFIRTETFKPASLMASGSKLNLAIPVLAKIYKGLNRMSTSSSTSALKFPFPAHYIHGWMAHYFHTHFKLDSMKGGPKMISFSGEGGARNYSSKEARDLIHRGDSIEWNPLSFAMQESWTICDDKTLSDSRFGRLVSIRPCFLTLRNGRSFILEPYSPHRFSRQFGYCQSIPFDTSNDTRSVSLEEGLKYWCLSTLRYTKQREVIPCAPVCLRKHSTHSFKTWWQKVHNEYFIKHQDILLRSNQKDTPVLLEDRAPAAPPKLRIKPPIATEGHCYRPGKQLNCLMEENSNSSERTPNFRHKKQLEFELFGANDASQGSTETVDSPIHPASIRAKRKFSAVLDQAGPSTVDKANEIVSCPSKKSMPLHSALPSPAAPSCMSVWNGDDTISCSRRVTLNYLWESVSKKMSRCHLESLPVIKRDVEKVFEEMGRYESQEVSSLRVKVVDYFTSVELYNTKKSSLGPRSTLLGDKEKELAIIVGKAAENINNLEAFKEEQANVEKQIESLQAKLTEIKSSIIEAEGCQSQIQVAKSVIEKEISTMQSQVAEDEANEDYLATMKQTLEADRQGFVHFKLSHLA